MIHDSDGIHATNLYMNIATSPEYRYNFSGHWLQIYNGIVVFRVGYETTLEMWQWYDVKYSQVPL